jgi:hypothetical protein
LGRRRQVLSLHSEGKTLSRTTDSSWGQSAVANPNDAEVGFVWAAGGTGYPGLTSTYTRQWIAGLGPFGTGTDRWSLTNKTLGANTAITVLGAGNVGIGTTAPAEKLQVIGNIGVGAGTYNGGVYANSSTSSVDTNWGFDFLRTAGQADYSTRLKYYPVTGESRKGGIWNSLSNTWVLYGDSNNTPNVIVPSGNVGIGTTSPSEKLQVDGNIKVPSTSGSGLFFVSGAAPSGISWYSQPGTSDGPQLISYGSAHIIIDSDNNDADTRFFTIRKNGTSFANSTELFRVTEAGNVGIGTTAPVSLLHISSASSGTIATITNTAAGGYSRLALINAERSLLITNNAGDDLISFSYANANRLQFNLTDQWFNSGNVGIGTTSPTVPLQIVKDNATISMTNTTAFAVDTGSRLFLGGKYDTAGTTSPFAWIVGAKENATDGNQAGYLSITTVENGGGFAERMRVTSTGNVGIGTTSPTTYSLSGTHTEIFGGSTYSFLHVNTTTVKSFLAVNEASLLTALFTFSAHPLTFGTNNTEKMRITSCRQRRHWDD